MVTVYILIFVLLTPDQGNVGFSAEFNSKIECQAALNDLVELNGQAMRRFPTNKQMHVECYPKG